MLAPNTPETRFTLPGSSSVPGSNTGKQLGVVAPGKVWTVGGQGAQQTLTGSSFAVPLATGIAAELMLVVPSLQQPANFVKVAEYIEATADDVEAPGWDPNTGFGRVNFWKAVLSARNGGLAAEGRTASGGNDAFFTSLPLIDAAGTTWYGFEVRVSQANAALWLKDNSTPPVYTEVTDAGQARPAIPNAADGEVIAYLSTQPHRDANGKLLPAVPFSAAELRGPPPIRQCFLGRFSIKSDQLTGKVALLAFPLGVTPNGDAGSLFNLPINDLSDLRKAQSAGNPAIRALVPEFDNFVVYIEQCVPTSSSSSGSGSSNSSITSSSSISFSSAKSSSSASH